MIHRTFQNIHWLEFKNLQKFSQLRHACFTSSLPITPPSGMQHCEITIKQIVLGNCSCRLAAMKQVHKTTLQFVEDSYDKDLPCDAIATNQPHTILVVQHADCQPCLLFDPVKNVIAAVHSGWRGSVQNIYQQTIYALQQRYGCKAQEIIACIGPSLGPCHAEFIHYKEELPESFRSYHLGHCLFDFWNISKHQLLDCGLREEHINMTDLCTYCNQALFFSFRKNRTSCRNATCIALTKAYNH